MSEEVNTETDSFNQDFTTATRWEVFCARLEEIIHDWKLPYKKQCIGKLPFNALSVNDWETKEELVTYDGMELKVTLYTVKLASDTDRQDDVSPDSARRMSVDLERAEKLSQLNIKSDCQTFVDLMSLENNWCTLDEKSCVNIHPLARWYGLRQFVVISTVGGATISENQRRILLSSIHLAIGETNITVPVFVQALKSQQNVYSGVCEHENTRVHFDIIHLSQTHPTCKYLSGILDMFKEKIPYEYKEPATVSVRFTYILKQFPESSFVLKRKFPFSDRNNDIEIKSNAILPFGVSVDPVREFVLYCKWLELAENVVMDSRNYSDFDPMLSQTWSFRLHYEALPNTFLRECLFEFLSECDSTKTLHELIGAEYAYSATSEIASRDDLNPLERLTVSKISKLTTSMLSAALSSDGSSAQAKNKTSKKGKPLEGPLTEDQLMAMLYFLFPDAQPNSSNAYKVPSTDNFDPLRIKSAFDDSLVHRLSMLLALCGTYLGGLRAIAQLWIEFAQEMRYRVERSIFISGIAEGFPDPRTCLLHQKLQMLNICINRRRIREGNLSHSMANSNQRNMDSRSDESDDEFFDCDATNDDDVGEQTKDYLPWNKPEGRLSKLNDMKLIDSDEYLYVPITQEPVPKTEDQLEDDAEILLKLGPESELRTQIMSASLLSDMESFKAANPNGKIEDFIRWYSPRDWIEEDNIKIDDSNSSQGRLSSRMLIPGNTWQNVWNTAKPVPARRQRRLFDDTREAEKALHFLETRNIGQIVQLCIVPLFHASILRVREESSKFSSIIPNYEKTMEKLQHLCCRLSRDAWISHTTSTKGNSKQKWENMLMEITNTEYMVVKCYSVIRKLYPNVENFEDNDVNALKSLLSANEVQLEEGAFGPLSQQILRLFTQVKRAQSEQLQDLENIPITLPEAVEKEFTVRVCGQTSHAIGTGGPQFLRIILKPEEFRICGAFSHDIKFF
ncbi:rab3 GTPase-activating protein catalytic subunit [Contarinia nasturtii]|uniref:rab3 GTPase-activating protein catalytic subunit n=1 Tax=Contarinia nasturtii TaxID=265458 RepID=UPI0012D38C7E|nr:rab3 GTPase-activating protein catalytic subunit [Contarinia nasturtii]